jgi:membrane associated rhomboid family serine protease
VTSDPGPSLRLVEVFRSRRLADCDSQTLILSAVGIHSWTLGRDGEFAIFVPEEKFELALRHLSEAAREAIPPVARPRPAPAMHPHAWTGSLLYAIVLVAIAYAAGASMLGVDWFDAGALRGTIPQTGEWWRVMTALTLHADVAHLVGNLVFGVVLGYFAGRSLGIGLAWASIVIGAALGNAVDATWMPVQQRSIGASTAVFATLGLLSAYAWRRESAPQLRWARRWAPLIAGIILLAFTGAGGERTDVVAHVMGFAAGAGLGALWARVDPARFMNRGLQWVAGAIAIASIVVAWWWPLNRS